MSCSALNLIPLHSLKPPHTSPSYYFNFFCPSTLQSPPPSSFLTQDFCTWPSFCLESSSFKSIFWTYFFSNHSELSFPRRAVSGISSPRHQVMLHILTAFPLLLTDLLMGLNFTSSLGRRNGNWTLLTKMLWMIYPFLRSLPPCTVLYYHTHSLHAWSSILVPYLCAMT